MMPSCSNRSLLPKDIVAFISNEMKIDMNSLLGKLDEDDIRVDRGCLEWALFQFARIVMDQESSAARNRPSNDWYLGLAAHSLTECFSEVSSCLSGEGKRVLDSLHHAFCSYSDGGLHQLFTRQECEAWYPRVILDKVLTPNDITTLPADVFIYRGTSSNEILARKFGQSWTTCREVAHDFAFSHYVGQLWFERRKRVVLEAVIARDDVYFSDQSHCEREVVVNVQKLRNVGIFDD